MSSTAEKNCFSITLKVLAKPWPSGGYLPKIDSGGGKVIDWALVAKHHLYNMVDDCSDLWSGPSKQVDFGKPNLPSGAAKNPSYFFKKGATKEQIKNMEVDHICIGLNFSTYAELQNWLDSSNGQALMGVAEEAFVSRLLTYSDAP